MNEKLTEKSPMPDGLLDTLSNGANLRDLIGYLQQANTDSQCSELGWKLRGRMSCTSQLIMHPGIKSGSIPRYLRSPF